MHAGVGWIKVYFICRGNCRAILHGYAGGIAYCITCSRLHRVATRTGEVIDVVPPPRPAPTRVPGPGRLVLG